MTTRNPQLNAHGALTHLLTLEGLPPDAGALDALVPEIDSTVAALRAIARR